MCVCPPTRTAPCAAVGFVSPKPRINNRLSKVHCHDPHIPHPPASLQTMCAECLATWVTSNQTCPIDQKPLAANKVGGFLLPGGGVWVRVGGGGQPAQPRFLPLPLAQCPPVQIVARSEIDTAICKLRVACEHTDCAWTGECGEFDGHIAICDAVPGAPLALFCNPLSIL